MKNDFEKTIEKGTGLTIDHIRRTPLDQLRIEHEQKTGKLLTFFRGFPWIGRKVLCELVTRENVDSEIDRRI